VIIAPQGTRQVLALQAGTGRRTDRQAGIQDDLPCLVDPHAWRIAQLALRRPIQDALVAHGRPAVFLAGATDLAGVARPGNIVGRLQRL
jgi:hypothetical protein